MNSSPIARRFTSGSVTPASFARNRSSALTCTHVSWSPTARWTSRAATDESTPPESAQRTAASPTWARIRATASSTMFTGVQSGSTPQPSKRKRFRTSFPRSVWDTSGWNWTPKSPRSLSSIAAIGIRSVRAVTRKPSGAFVTASPWLIQTDSWGARSASSVPGWSTASAVAPYSRSPVAATSPPSSRAPRGRGARSAGRTAPRGRRRGPASEPPGSPRAHPHALRRLVRLPLGPDRRRDHELRLLELLDRGVARRGHRRREGAEQVERPVFLVRRSGEDLLHRGDLLRLHAGAARQARMEGRHPPVVAAARCLVRARQRGADHHCVRAARDRLRDVAAGPHASVRDHVAIPARLVEVLVPGRGSVGERRRLRDADTQDAACRARVARPDAHQHTDRAGPHQVERGGVRGAAADDHREVETGDEFLQVQRLRLRGYVLRRDHGALDHEDVQTGFQHRRREPLHTLRGQGGAGDDALSLDLLDPSAHELRLHRLAIELLHPAGRLVVGERGDLLVHRLGVLVAGPEALEIEAGEATEPAAQR